MTALIGCGIVWRFVQPAGLAPEQARLVLTSVVYYLFLPALVLLVLWQADIGIHTFNFTILGCSSVLFGIFVSWLLGRIFSIQKLRLGAMILAASFPNVTFLGLPVLEQAFGNWARSIAIQLDLFAAGPLLFTVGIMIAVYYGESECNEKKSVLSYLNAPPFWAAALAVVLNLNQIIIPDFIEGILLRLADAVVPLMLFSLGLALNWQAVNLRNCPLVVLIVLVKLFLMPLFALWLLSFLDMKAEYKAPSLLSMGMPTMLLGVVFCDRYRLDTALFAMAVTVTTLLSLITLPLWYEFANH